LHSGFSSIAAEKNADSRKLLLSTGAPRFHLFTPELACLADVHDPASAAATLAFDFFVTMFSQRYQFSHDESSANAIGSGSAGSSNQSSSIDSMTDDSAPRFRHVSRKTERRLQRQTIHNRFSEQTGSAPGAKRGSGLRKLELDSRSLTKH
jgi:hypothetical protein